MQSKRFLRPLQLFWLSLGLVIAGMGGIWLLWHGMQSYQTQQQTTQAQQAILEEAQALQAQQNFTACADRASQITAESSLFQAAQALVSTCERKSHDTILTQAKTKAAAGDFQTAIGLARRIPGTSPVRQDAQSLIGVWANQLLQQATALYENEGKTKEATALASSVPADLPLSQLAQQRMALWSQEWRVNSPRINTIRSALERKDWATMRSEAEQISGTSPFWQKQRQTWISKAESELAAEARQRAEAEQRRQAEADAQRLTQPQCEAIRDAYAQNNPYVVQAVTRQGDVIRRRCLELGVSIGG